MSSAVKDPLARQTIATAMETYSKAKKLLEDLKYVKLTPQDSPEARQARESMSDAKAKLSLTFAKFALGSVSAEDAYIEASKAASEALTQMGLYNASLAGLAQWASKVLPGVIIPLVNATIPAATGVGRFLGGKDARVLVSGHLNFKNGSYVLNASLVAVAAMQSQIADVRSMDSVAVGLKKVTFEFAADRPRHFVHVGVAGAVEVAVKHVPGGKPVVFEVLGEFIHAKRLFIAGSGRATLTLTLTLFIAGSGRASFGSNDVRVVLGIHKDPGLLSEPDSSNSKP